MATWSAIASSFPNCVDLSSARILRVINEVTIEKTTGLHDGCHIDEHRFLCDGTRVARG